MTKEQVMAHYEGAELVTNRYMSNPPEEGVGIDLDTLRVDDNCGALQYWCDSGSKWNVILWNEEKGFIAEITKYRELKVGDTVELNGLKGEVNHGPISGMFYLCDLEGKNNRLIGSETTQESSGISNRILGYSEGGLFPQCRTLQDLSKLYWVRKYELRYGINSAGEDSANKEDDKTANNMSDKRELIGYNWKEEKYIQAFNNLHPLHACKQTGADFRVGSATHGKVMEENLLDLWTVPVYKEKEKVFTMGFGEDTFKIVVKDGKAYHKTNMEDISNYVEKLVDEFDIRKSIGAYDLHLDIRAIKLTKTGCQSKVTTVGQWIDVLEAMDV